MSSFSIRLETGSLLEGDEADGYIEFLAADALEAAQDGDYSDAVLRLAEAARSNVRLVTSPVNGSYLIDSKELNNVILCLIAERRKPRL
jgi:hypothetical protein